MTRPSPLRRVRAVAVALAFAAACAPALAHADTSEPEELFAQAVELMKNDKFQEALPKLEEAQRRDPGLGTQFNLAVCYEKLGRLGSAYRNYVAVAQLAKQSGRKQREDAAREKIIALVGRIATLAITLADHDKDRLVVRVDGAVVAHDDLGGYAVDPGEHRIEVTAPAKKPWSTTLAAPAEGQRAAVAVPVLEDVKGDTKVVEITRDGSDPRRTWGFIAGGIGLAGLVAGGVTGILLLNAKSTADDRCKPRCIGADGLPDQEGIDAVNRGKALAPINVVAWGVGIAGVAVGAYLLLTGGSSTAPPAATGLRIVPSGGPAAASLSVSRAF